MGGSASVSRALGPCLLSRIPCSALQLGEASSLIGVIKMLIKDPLPGALTGSQLPSTSLHGKRRILLQTKRILTYPIWSG